MDAQFSPIVELDFTNFVSTTINSKYLYIYSNYNILKCNYVFYIFNLKEIISVHIYSIRLDKYFSNKT